MKLQTKLSPDLYIRALYQQMGSFTSFLEERFTGIFVGRFFSICYHSGWEWNRRLTNEKNRAIGYVKRTPEGSEVRFIHLYGDTNPLSLALMFLAGFIVGGVAVGMSDGPYAEHLDLYFSVLSGLFTMIFASAGTVIASYFTERGQEGCGILLAYLKDPVDPWHHEKSNR